MDDSDWSFGVNVSYSSASSSEEEPAEEQPAEEQPTEDHALGTPRAAETRLAPVGDIGPEHGEGELPDCKRRRKETKLVDIGACTDGLSEDEVFNSHAWTPGQGANPYFGIKKPAMSDECKSIIINAAAVLRKLPRQTLATLRKEVCLAGK